MQTSIPLQQKERIQLIDSIRGIALCGILILNIFFFASPFQTILNYNVFQETGRANMATWYLTNFMIEGSFRALFSMLFGAGAILLLSRLEKNQGGLLPADIYYRRLIWLLLFGLINAYVLLWPGDILYTYAICGLFIFPLRNSSTRLLLILVIFFITVTMFQRWLRFDERIELKAKGIAAQNLEQQNKTLTEDQKADLEAWNGYLKKREIENMRKESQKEIDVMQNGSYTKIWTHLQPINQKLESTKFYSDYFIDAMIFILLGMALFKTGVLTGEKPAWLYVVFVIVGYALGLGLGILEGSAWRKGNLVFFQFLEHRPLPIDIYQLHRIFVSIGHLGVIVVMWKSGVFQWLLKPFAALGQMAFTNYLMQSIICTLIFYGYGLGYFGKFQRYELLYFVVAVWAFQLIFSVIWLQFFRFGPLEWIWRSLTYWKIQPLDKEQKSDVVMAPQ